ncbi:precorrin-3B synthase [Pseudorhodobacter sp.]|uniref:precorrin-3B synthase n=1 Tax=Pseudorhodobacter sp. TaxID=1934400 RepID=UPI002AFFC477|nr:precorrin-3B synthase [Pseudorhodobacter sp.]
MNGAPRIKGWCPGALRPMMSGDGLIVRVRPPLGRLNPHQVSGIAALATSCGNGIVDLSNRANVQLRGVAAGRYEVLIDGLRALGVIDPDVTVESRRNILVTPFRNAGNANESLAEELASALAATDAPDVSAKFGYAVDAGATPVLQAAPADIRLERGADGNLLVCAGAHRFGKPVTDGEAVSQMLTLARWSLGHGTRMFRVLTGGTALPQGFTVPRQAAAPSPKPGLYPAGALVGMAFGQIDAATLDALANLGALRVTPWRMLLIEGADKLPLHPGLICDPEDPLLRIAACVGAPGCAQAHAGTRAVARNLARYVPAGKTLHVAGCAKGCALPRAASVTLTATAAGFDLIRNATADAAPEQTGLQPNDLPNYLQKALS